MGNRFELGPRAFVPFDKLDYVGHAPHSVIKQTDVALTAHRETANQRVIEAGNSFLLDSTINLIDLMQQGIHFDNQARNGLTRAELQRAMGTTGSVSGKGFFAREAFRIAIAIWAQIPECIRIVRFGSDNYQFSRHGRFSPPTTTSGLIEGFEELRTGTVDAVGNIDSHARETAEVFFRVGAHLRIKQPTH